MGKLNPKQVENLTEPGTYEDGDGLRLVVKPTGRKSWLLRFQLAGRRREMGLGSFPEVSLTPPSWTDEQSLTGLQHFA